jgi:hypothetical protein
MLSVVFYKLRRPSTQNAEGITSDALAEGNPLALSVALMNVALPVKEVAVPVSVAVAVGRNARQVVNTATSGTGYRISIRHWMERTKHWKNAR